MLKNYLKIALRAVRRRPGHTFINVVGLAVGMACCLLLTLYIGEEISYDRHHPDHERIYRVAFDIETPTANRTFADGPPTLAPAILNDYPQVEEAVRLWKRSSLLVSRSPEQRGYEDNVFYADPSIFDVFSLPLAQGIAESALDQPETVVLSARMAERYFGEENPMGRTLTIGDTDYEVTGVLRARTHNSHVTFDFISSILPVEQQNEWFGNWHLTMFHTYVKLQENADAAQFEAELAGIAERYVAEELQQFESEYRFFLQAITNIHLHSNLRGELGPPGNALYIYIFGVVAVLILVIASLNYINLTTAQSAARANEIGVRKVVGSGRRQLVWQFLSESLMVAAGALILAIGVTIVSFPLFNAFTGYRLDFSKLVEPGMLAGVLSLLILTGGLAGLFPALALSSMKPLQIMKGRSGGSGRSTPLRKVLVTGQFTISLILIVGSIAAVRQLEFMKEKDLGFDEEQVLVLPTRGIPDASLHERFTAELQRTPTVRAATASSFVPGRGVDNFSIELLGEAERMNQSMFFLFVDFDFVSTYEIEIIAGRSLREEFTTDREEAFLMNEAGLEAFGWTTPQEAIGKRVQAGFGGRQGEIVGIFRDFNFRSAHASIEPLMLTYAPPRFAYVSTRLGTGDLTSTLSRVEALWEEFFPDLPFEHFFLDEDFNRQYQADERTAFLMFLFAGLAVLIACMGLLGLAAHSARAYTKEIGIRKVLGASVGSIVALLTRDFVRLVTAAVLLGTPIAWFAVDRWLETFAYRVDVSWEVFAAAGLTAVGIAVLTVSYQAIRAAHADPVKSLRYE